MEIISIKAREILDSRGNPTIEADVLLSNGVCGRASVPSGASTGAREAYELRDGMQNRYQGKGVSMAVSHVNEELHHALKGMNVAEQEQIDATMCALDGTENKSRLGANAILAVSLAVARAHSQTRAQPLHCLLNQGESMIMPVPLMNVLNGGAHADNNVDIQEFMLVPLGAHDFAHALQMGAEIFHVLKFLLKKQGLSTAVGDEGGFAPNLRSNHHALDLLSDAVKTAGYALGDDVAFALDVAASELYQDGFYHLPSDNKKLDSAGMIDYYQGLLKNYPIISIEDGLDENDWTGWQQMTAVLGSRLQLVGDDLFVTNAGILQEGISQQVANAILIKPNQIGTLSETRQAIRLAQKNNYGCILSHRSGETEDTFIADLAVATGCGQIKTGSLCRSDRVAKYNQLLRINEISSLAYLGKMMVKSPA